MESVIVTARVPKSAVERLKGKNVSRLIREFLIAEAERVKHEEHLKAVKEAQKHLENVSLKEITEDIRKFREARHVA